MRTEKRERYDAKTREELEINYINKNRTRKHKVCTYIYVCVYVYIYIYIYIYAYSRALSLDRYLSTKLFTDKRDIN